MVYDLRAGSSVSSQLKGHDGTSNNNVDFIRLPPEEAVKVNKSFFSIELYSAELLRGGLLLRSKRRTSTLSH